MQAPDQPNVAVAIPASSPPRGELTARHRRYLLKTPLGIWVAALLGGLTLAVFNAVAIAWAPGNPIERSVRIRHHLVDAGQQLGFAWFLAAAVVCYHRALKPALFKRASYLVKRRLAAWLPFVALASGLILLLSSPLTADFREFAHRQVSLNAAPHLARAMAYGCACLLALGLVLFNRWWRPGLALAAGCFALALLVGNHTLLKHNYPGVHFLLGLTALAVLLATFKPCRFWRGPSERWQRAVGFGLPLVCLPAFVAEPSRTLQAEQLKLDGSVVARRTGELREWVQQWVPREVAAAVNASPERKPVPSSNPGLLPERPLVVMLTIDAVRADVLENPALARRFHALSELKRQSVYFDNARAPGSQTVTSLSGMFSGLYFSQQYWTRHPEVGHLFLGDDQPSRFPEVLQQAGIKTVTFSATYFLLNRFGIVRGFDEERFLDNPGQAFTDYSPGAQLTDQLLGAIERYGHGSAFFYAHYLDTHFPYKRGGQRGSAFERYLGAIGYVDRQLKRVLRKLEQLKLLERTLIVVASDHGEAFGEHDSQYHATTLYEEQLRVPLMFRVPGLDARVVKAPASLMDVGPTLLDLLGQTTPAHFMGQSLVPLLRGRPMTFTRPLVAEGRLKKAFYYPDGYKLIVDDKDHTVELYDLERDPREFKNLIDHPKSRGVERLAELRQFFEQHQIRRPGYEIPYRQ